MNSMGGTNMWAVVYLAQSEEVAKNIEYNLDKEGILVKVKPVNKCSCKDKFFEILVLESEIEEAHNILYQLDINILSPD
jgi:hypothetical protein